MLELADLIEAFKTKFNVTVAAAPAGGGAAAARRLRRPRSRPSSRSCSRSGGAKKIQVIKVVREITSLGLKEAKDLVDSRRARQGRLSKAEAEEIKKKLEEQGATVELK